MMSETDVPDQSLTSQQRLFPWRRSIPYGILLLLPCALLWLNPNWIYTPMGTIDPWLYHGLFRENAYLQLHFPGTYYATRLPWILPGLLAYSTLPVMVANYALHLCFYYLTLFSLYFTIQYLTDVRTALLTTVLFGLNCHFLTQTGWDYVTCPILAYLSLTFALETKAFLSRRPWPWLCGAGAAFTCVLYCHLYPLVLGPVAFLYYVLASRKLNRASIPRSILQFLGCCLLGGVIITVCLGAMNRLRGADFWFYAPSLKAFFLVTKQTHWKAPDYSWIFIADWLVLPAATAIASGVLLLRNLLSPDKGAPPLTLLLQSVFVVMAIAILLAELSGQYFLQYTYYSCYLLPFTLMTLAVHFLRVPAGLPNGCFYPLLAGVPALFVYLVKYNVLLPWFTTRASVVLTASIVLVGGLTIRALLRYRGLTFVFAVLPLTVVSAAFFPFYLGAAPAQPVYARITTSIDLIGKFCHARPGRVWIWYDRQEPQGLEYVSISSAYFYGYSLLNDQFPSPQAASPTAFRGGEPLVILSARQEVGTAADKSLRQIGLQYRTLDVREVAADSVRYFLTFGIVEREQTNGLAKR
jgi:hypothetical protein